MNTTKYTGRQPQPIAPGIEMDAADSPHAARKLTFFQNAILTVKVLVGFGLLGIALWGINLWTAAK